MDQQMLSSRLRKRTSPIVIPKHRPDDFGPKDRFYFFRRIFKTLRRRLEYILFRMALGGLRLLGIDRASRWAGTFWRNIAPRTKRHQRALRHLALAFPEKSTPEHETIARAMWENLGRVMAEACMLDKITAEPDRLIIATPEIIDALKQANGRAVVASMHYGNWELGMWPFTREGFSSLALYQEIQNPYLDALIHQLRAPVLPGGLYGKGHGTPRKLLQAVKDGHPMAILADLRDNRGVEVDFFGRQAPSTPFPALVARQTGALLIAGRVKRTQGAHFVMEGQLIDVPVTDDKNADIVQATQNLQTLFEQWIRQNPEQWMWAHQRWGKGH